jgi:hypothetical protein
MISPVAMVHLSSGIRHFGNLLRDHLSDENEAENILKTKGLEMS